MVVQQQEVPNSLHSTQIRIKAKVEKEAILVAVQQIRTNNNNKKTSLMEEDVVRWEPKRTRFMAKESIGR